MHKLKMQLARDCLKVNRVHNDGNSLFRAIGDQIGEEFMYSFYRNKCVEYIRDHIQDFEDCIGDEEAVEEYCT